MGISIGGVDVELRTKAFINGEFVDALDGSVFDSYVPSNGTVLAQVAACSDVDVDRAVRSARAAFDAGTWSRIAPAERKTIMLRFADLVERDLEPLAHLEALDAGKPIADCLGVDLPEVVKTLRWYAEAADKVFGKTAPTGEGSLALIVKEPIGVVGAVLPWNFPLLMLAWKIAPALIAGNSVVVKPPELASLTTIRMAELAYEAGVPAGVFNVVPGLGHIAGKALGLHMDVDAVAFTGSTEIGREFLRYAAASNLKNVVLECGGKSPQIVMADCADRLDMIAADLVVLVNASVHTTDPRAKFAKVLQYVLPSLPGIGNDIKKPGMNEYCYDRLPVKAFVQLQDLWRNVSADISSVTQPALIFNSVDDHVVESSNAQWIAQHTASTDKTTVTLNNSYHVATLDYDAEEIFQTSLQFIRRLS